MTSATAAAKHENATLIHDVQKQIKYYNNQKAKKYPLILYA